MNIVLYNNTDHREQVILLWNRVFDYQTARNLPGLVIDKKIEVGDGLFFVAISEAKVIGTVMAGYDGHRGWIYSLAVAEDFRGRGIGSALLKHAEKELTRRGCIKINLQVLGNNENILPFYLGNGFDLENRISLGKQIPENIPLSSETI